MPYAIRPRGNNLTEPTSLFESEPLQLNKQDATASIHNFGVNCWLLLQRHDLTVR